MATHSPVATNPLQERQSVKQQDDNKNKIERGPDGKWLGSGNPAGRPLGSRNKLPELIYGRAAEVWKKHEHNLDKWASEDFREFAQWCARVMSRDVAVSIEQHSCGHVCF